MILGTCGAETELFVKKGLSVPIPPADWSVADATDFLFGAGPMTFLGNRCDQQFKLLGQNEPGLDYMCTNLGMLGTLEGLFTFLKAPNQCTSSSGMTDCKPTLIESADRFMFNCPTLDSANIFSTT